MDYWTLYDYLVNTVQPFMLATGNCLYNALVLTQSTQVQEPLSREKLLRIRDSAYALIQFIEEEVQLRDSEEKDLEDL